VSVAVVGMHRSGTSVVTHALSLLGLRLGEADDLYAAADNPDGHFESQRLSGHNEWLLGELGGAWDAPPVVPPRWWEGDDDKIPWAQRLFAETYGDEPGWLWKDPRLCFLLPFWREAVGDFTVLFVGRHPDEVARSLADREGWPLARGRYLYDRYIGAALAGMAGHPMVALAYADLVRDPEPVLHRLAGDLAALGEPVDPGLAPAAAEVVSRRRHELVPPRLAGLPPRARHFVPPTWTAPG
jgi:hypothetical protein